MYLKLKQTGSNQATVSILTGKGAYYFHFSYETCVGLKRPGEMAYTCKNVWSQTTGHHLGNLKRKFGAIEVPAINFSTMLDNMLDAIAQDVQEEK